MAAYDSLSVMSNKKILLYFLQYWTIRFICTKQSLNPPSGTNSRYFMIYSSYFFIIAQYGYFKDASQPKGLKYVSSGINIGLCRFRMTLNILWACRLSLKYGYCFCYNGQ